MQKLSNYMANQRYWLFVTNNDNWKVVRDNDIYGFNDRTKKDLEKLNLGDLAVIYIKGKNIGGIFEITSLNEQTNIKFKVEDYPYKIKLRKICVPRMPVEFDKNMVGKISIFKDKVHWGTILMGRATKEITKQDYDYFREILEC